MRNPKQERRGSVGRGGWVGGKGLPLCVREAELHPEGGGVPGGGAGAWQSQPWA